MLQHKFAVGGSSPSSRKDNKNASQFGKPAQASNTKLSFFYIAGVGLLALTVFSWVYSISYGNDNGLLNPNTWKKIGSLWPHHSCSEKSLSGKPSIDILLDNIDSTVYGDDVEIDPTIICSQDAIPLAPIKYSELTDNNVKVKFRSQEYIDVLSKHLSEAVQIDTTSYDGTWDIPSEDPNVEDPLPHHKNFVILDEYLTKTYPKVHDLFNKWYVNRYALIYRLNGTDSSLKPILLTSHLDVVPIDEKTIDRWTYPPFSGKIADGKIWGRGTSDTKATLIGIFEAIETLLTSKVIVNNKTQEWRPKRTILLAFGNDEESNSNGARKISTFLGETLGYNGNKIELILDEGETIQPINDTFAFGNVGIAEKGYVDIAINITSEGGHSSVPPRHTSIGFISRFLNRLENHPHISPLIQGHLENVPLEHPGVPAILCNAAYDSPLISNRIKRLANAVGLAPVDKLKKLALASLALEIQHKSDRFLIWRIATTQAVDVINGGVKANALPEEVFASVNYRVDPYETGAFTNLDQFLVSPNNELRDGKSFSKENESIRNVENRLVEKVILGDLLRLSKELRNIDWFKVYLKGVDDSEFHLIKPDLTAKLFQQMWKSEWRNEFIADTSCSKNHSHKTLLKSCNKEIKEMDEFVESLNDYNNNNNEMHSFISGKYPNNINITVYVESRKFLAPSPITKTDETSRWNVVVGTLRHVFESSSKEDIKHPIYETIASVPALMAGNTDTARYWELSNNIFRFSPLSSGLAQGVHTVDEAIAISDLVGVVVYFHEFIRNMDEL